MKMQYITGGKMKKRFCVTALVMILAAPVWCNEFAMSLGGGGFIGGHFTRYKLMADGNIDVTPQSSANVKITSLQNMNQLDFGGGLFFDATWAEFGVNIVVGMNSYSDATDAKNGGKIVYGDEATGTGRETMLGLSLLGKYPFELTQQISIFPLLGIDYRIALQELRQPEGRKLYDRATGIQEQLDSNKERYKLSAWNALFVVMGAGLDYRFHSSWFLRTELLYNIRLMTPWESDGLKKLKEQLSAPDPRLSGLSSGPALKISAGWRFY